MTQEQVNRENGLTGSTLSSPARLVAGVGRLYVGSRLDYVTALNVASPREVEFFNRVSDEVAAPYLSEIRALALSANEEYLYVISRDDGLGILLTDSTRIGASLTELGRFDDVRLNGVSGFDLAGDNMVVTTNEGAGAGTDDAVVLSSHRSISASIPRPPRRWCRRGAPHNYPNSVTLDTDGIAPM